MTDSANMTILISRAAGKSLEGDGGEGCVQNQGFPDPQTQV